MTKRLIRWIAYNFIFALLPLGMSLLLRKLLGGFNIGVIASSPEVLFFSLMICATALGDLSETPMSKFDLAFRIFTPLLLLGAVVSAILYGVLVYDNITGPQSTDFQINLFWLSVWIAVVFFIISTVIQVMIGRLED